MAQNQLPPQAYTAETIAYAYEWLKSQPPNVQEMAKSADTLVALYLKAKRNGFSGKQSTESFQADLKNISEKMKSFGDFAEIEKRVDLQIQDQLGLKARNLSMEQSPKVIPPTQQTMPPTINPAAASAPVQKPAPVSSSALDARTLQALNQVQNAFNLSSPDEALRLLVQVGFNKLKDQLP